jgi:hypothetical protein
MRTLQWIFGLTALALLCFMAGALYWGQAQGWLMPQITAKPYTDSDFITFVQALGPELAIYHSVLFIDFGFMLAFGLWGFCCALGSRALPAICSLLFITLAVDVAENTLILQRLSQAMTAPESLATSGISTLYWISRIKLALFIISGAWITRTLWKKDTA